jgi:hypothetical protein
LIAALAAAGGLALFNDSPSAPRLGGAAVVAVALRTLQSLYFSTLPHSVVPGDESSIAVVTVVAAALGVIVIQRSARSSQ